MTVQKSQGEMIAVLNGTTSLDELYPILNANRYMAGWHKKRRSLWPEPDSQFTPQHWRYAESKLALDKAGDWISTELAERRNLLMFNPVGDNDYSTVRTLVAAYQMVRPGEYAHAHRHSPSALRMVLDTPEGLFTVVNGVQIHDLRHSFICRRLMLWQASGDNLGNAMMALSTYVGHVNVADTYWYLQAVPELMAIAGDRFETFGGKLGEARHG